MKRPRKYPEKKLAAAPQAFSGRIPPQALDAEESVLGSILLDNQAINVCLERLRAEDFYKTAHQTIFEARIRVLERCFFKHVAERAAVRLQRGAVDVASVLGREPIHLTEARLDGIEYR